MATPPQVQSLSQAMTELDPAYAAGRAVVQKRQEALPAKYDAQRAGINAARGQGFATINNQATGRGGSFSGVPVDEQATYLSTKYLPGMQQADFQQNDEDLTLQGEFAGMDKEQRLAAQGRVDKQTSDLNSWNNMIAQQEFTAREADKQRNFTASQAATARSFTASQNAPKKLSPYEAAMGIIGGAAAKGNVTSNAFQLARDAYKAAGGNTSQFATEFWKYVPAKANKDGTWKNYYYG
jgi:hypothetical protein